MKTRVQIINNIFTNAFKTIYLKFFQWFIDKPERHKKDDNFYQDNTIYDFNTSFHNDDDDDTDKGDNDRSPLV